ncbi:MAG: hypothetical protein PHE24_01715 [Patescibacteria group bacterium]|nr:hypothetical protein [Patescibacteria group bacterium]
MKERINPHEINPDESDDYDDKKNSADEPGSAELSGLEPEEEPDDVDAPKKITSAFDVIKQILPDGDDEIDELDFDR